MNKTVKGPKWLAFTAIIWKPRSENCTTVYVPWGEEVTTSYPAIEQIDINSNTTDKSDC